MAARKSSSKKTKKQSKPEDVIIEGHAQEVDPATVSPRETKAKAEATSKTASQRPTPNNPKNPARLSLIVSLIALGLGGAGAGLGGFAYLSAGQNDNAPQDSFETAITPIREATQTLATDIIDLNAKLAALDSGNAAASRNTEDKITRIINDIEALEARLSAVSNEPAPAVSQAPEAPPHRHDDYAVWTEVRQELTVIRAELEAIKLTTAQPETTEDVTRTINDRKPSSSEDGWWQQLLGAFSVTRIDTPLKEDE